MKTFLFLITLLACCSGINAQQFRKVDYEKIGEIVKTTSAFSYPALMRRYVALDTTLNNDELFYLYYGFPSRENYSGYASSDYEDSVRALLNVKELSDDSLRLLVSYCMKVMETTPFSLRNLSYMGYAYRKLNMPDERRKIGYLYRGIANTITSTGDGLSTKTAYYVISVSNEYEILDWLDYESAGMQSLIGNCDKLSIKKDNPEKIDAVYFNVSILFDSMQKMFDKKK